MRATEEFGYIIDKLRAASFRSDPFRHLVIDDLFTAEHFAAITTASEVARAPLSRTEDLIDDLEASGYRIQSFPGCTTSREEYLACYNEGAWPVDKGLLEGFGLTMRLQQYETELLSQVVAFFNGDAFQTALAEKFGVERPTRVDTAIQKYMHGYEISPHPDVRRKALTYMININTSPASEAAAIHTHLLRFKPERAYVQSFWENNPKAERCWVPWDWCESVTETRANNSVVLFAPGCDTLHAVKLRYDHLAYQRTQIYGNLWYHDEPLAHQPSYQDLDALVPA